MMSNESAFKNAINDAAHHPTNHAPIDEKLREETRLLGRLLGDAIRAVSGESTFQKTEQIRQLAVGFHRASSGDRDAILRQLDHELTALSIEQTLSVIRAFSYFSLQKIGSRIVVGVPIVLLDPGRRWAASSKQCPYWSRRGSRSRKSVAGSTMQKSARC